MGQKQTSRRKKEKGYIFLIWSSSQVEKKAMLQGIQKDLLKNNFIIENRYIALNYGRDAQKFFTKTETSELLFWWEECSLLQGIPKSVLENIYKGKDVIISISSSQIEKISTIFERETSVIVVEIVSDETTLKIRYSSTAEETEQYLKQVYQNYMKLSQNIESSVSKHVRVYHNGLLENGKKNLKKELLTIRQELIDSKGRFIIDKPYIPYKRISTFHENYCFMNPLKCCNYDQRTEICILCHLTKKEKEKVKINLRQMERIKSRWT
eukprot:gene5890-9718_t